MHHHTDRTVHTGWGYTSWNEWLTGRYTDLIHSRGTQENIDWSFEHILERVYETLTDFATACMPIPNIGISTLSLAHISVIQD